MPPPTPTPSARDARWGGGGGGGGGMSRLGPAQAPQAAVGGQTIGRRGLWQWRGPVMCRWSNDEQPVCGLRCCSRSYPSDLEILSSERRKRGRGTRVLL